MENNEKKTADLDRRSNLLVCGISHLSSTLEEREKFQLNRKEIPKALKTFLSLDGVKEVALLSTCNRFEMYFCTTRDDRAIDVARRFYRKFKKLDIAPFEHLFYSKHASSVVRHLCRVASAMDSLVLGETQIISQVRESYSLACIEKKIGKILHKAFHAAFRASKTVRRDTAIGQGQRSVAGEAVAILKQKLSPDDPILIIGVNKNTKLAAKCLFDAGYKNLTFLNRTLYKAEKLAALFDVQGFDLDMVQEKMNLCRAIISCTSSPGYIISSNQVKKWRDNQKNTLFIVDMAVPRDVDTSDLSGKDIHVIDLQDLKNYLEIQNLERKANFPLAEQIIERVVSAFQAWLEISDDPLLGDIAEKFEKIRQNNLAEYLDHFRYEDQKIIEEFSRKLVRQMLSIPKKYIQNNGNQNSI